MAQFISLVPEKKLKRLNSQQGPSATTTLGSLQKQETPVKPPVKNLPSLEALAKQKKINLGNNNVNGNKSLAKGQEVEEWKKGADRDIKKFKKVVDFFSRDINSY